jgi:non-ribosomal peptide synthetase component F
VRDRVLAAFAHQDLPFDRLIEALELEHQLSHSPLFQTALVLQNAGGGQVDLPGLSLAAMESTTVSAKFDVTVTLHETTEGTLVRRSYLRQGAL